MTFELGRGFQARTSDRMFGLSIGGRAQLRGEVAVPINGDADGQWQVRRARLNVIGSFLGEANRVRLQLAFSPADLNAVNGATPSSPVLDLYVELAHHRDLRVVVGQMKVGLNREFRQSSRDLRLVDRSVVHGEFSLQRDLGLVLSSDDFLGIGRLRYALGLFAGEGRDGLLGADAGLLYTARLEVSPFGFFGDYPVGRIAREAEPRLALAAAFAYLEGAHLDRGITGAPFTDGGRADYVMITLDAVFAWLGWDLYAELFLREGQRVPPPASAAASAPLAAPRDGLGFLLRAAYLLPGLDLSLAGRLSMNLALPDLGGTSMHDRGELAAAVAYHFDGHFQKITLDAAYLWNAPEGFDRGSFRVRLQLDVSL